MFCVATLAVCFVGENTQPKMSAMLKIGTCTTISMWPCAHNPVWVISVLTTSPLASQGRESPPLPDLISQYFTGLPTGTSMGHSTDAPQPPTPHPPTDTYTVLRCAGHLEALYMYTQRSVHQCQLCANLRYKFAGCYQMSLSRMDTCRRQTWL